MKAARLEAIGGFVVREVEKPVPGPDDLLVRVEAAGICGTDRHLFHGEFPCRPPVTLGHEFSGIVEAIGDAVRDFRPGMRITGDPNIACGRCAQCRRGRVNLCENLQAIGIHRDGGFADYVLVPQRQAYELPLSLPPEHGAFCEPLACCLHGVDMAGIEPGSSVVVLGGGVIGMLTVQLARLAGATAVVLVTRQAVRRQLAEEIGATHSFDPGTGDAIEGIAGKSGLVPCGADVVIECAGVAETMMLAPKLARNGGTVVILGVMPQGEKIEIEPFDLLFREVKILTSFLNPHVHGRAAALIASGTIKVDRLISRRIGINDLPDAVANPPRPGEVKVLVMPGLR
ncbi:zinc-dependent alcohol dehydrogenase family protein [Shinella curvata]|uniref:Zinc-dependent alcohol dehydrogenase family protein n=1 Tax=Shinella curvata TaxID=1817964 RepID=A0ABT8XIT6_9HYPH|nr:zinc-dependent alcohol dehydrogenase family protein [Shinella curvata]MCJ8052577.1 zinc-dependent alcohol dehydrogenase family protein [Shinella curvata]MDO6123657.1 zinc-dependent alcohol dehydrogenase family protein [Shinella curvata]